MNVASLELCKELFELSGWEDTEKVYRQWANGGSYAPIGDFELVRSSDLSKNGDVAYRTIPAYDLGYLLRKLPENMLCGFLLTNDKTICVLDVSYKREKRPSIYGKTPEDAVAQLAIQLFKQGILIKEPTYNVAGNSEILGEV